VDILYKDVIVGSELVSMDYVRKIIEHVKERG